MIQLKPAEPGDAPALLDIQRRAFAALLKKYRDYETNPAAETVESLRRKIASGEKDYYFILDGNAPVGLAAVRWQGEVCRVSPIGLLPERQGNGLGSQAMALLEQRYPQAERWELDTIGQEPGLCRFYETLGYRRTGGTHSIQPGMDIVDFCKGKESAHVPSDFL